MLASCAGGSWNRKENCYFPHWNTLPKLVCGKCTTTLASIRGLLVISVGCKLTMSTAKHGAEDEKRK